MFAALHYLEPEFDPSWRFISEYQLGRFGWVMGIAFFSLAVSAGSLFLAIRSQIRTVGGYVGLSFLLLSTVGLLMAAVFTTDPITIGAATARGNLHSAGAVLGGCLGYAALLLGWSLARNRAWVSARRALAWTTAIAGVGLAASFYMSAMIGMADGKFGPELSVGWPNRLLIVAYAGWLMALAWRVLRAKTQSG